MIERKIYAPWAFSENELEKRDANYSIFNEFKEKYKVFRYDTKMNLVDGVDCVFDDYDIVIGRKAGYAHALYKIYKNSPKLTTAELALLCDGGNLCFGYTMEGSLIHVFED